MTLPMMSLAVRLSWGIFSFQKATASVLVADSLVTQMSTSIDSRSTIRRFRRSVG